MALQGGGPRSCFPLSICVTLRKSPQGGSNPSHSFCGSKNTQTQALSVGGASRGIVRNQFTLCVLLEVCNPGSGPGMDSDSALRRAAESALCPNCPACPPPPPRAGNAAEGSPQAQSLPGLSGNLIQPYYIAKCHNITPWPGPQKSLCDAALNPSKTHLPVSSGPQCPGFWAEGKWWILAPGGMD